LEGQLYIQHPCAATPPDSIRVAQQFRPRGGLLQQRHAQPVIDDKWLAEPL
jgi:hypothetical protein